MGSALSAVLPAAPGLVPKLVQLELEGFFTFWEFLYKILYRIICTQILIYTGEALGCFELIRVFLYFVFTHKLLQGH